MKLTLYSDLHLEFDPNFRPRNPGSDVLILAGDICVADYFNRGPESPKRQLADQFLEFFEHVSSEWGTVIYINGNHESYFGRFDRTSSTLKKNLEHLTNIHHLDNEILELDGYTFVGTTLWTSLNNGNPITETIVQGAMNDYKVIQNKFGSTYRKLIPSDTTREHMLAKQFISQTSIENDRLVVVGHHAPSSQSVHSRYNGVNDYQVNFAYYSDLENFILDHPNIELFVHGHTHDSFSYEIGSTKVLCNPRGYNGENPNFDEELIIEL